MQDMGDFWLTRHLFQRGLGLVYLIAFVVALNQFRPLLGEHGLLPVPKFIQAVPFRFSPSLFYFFPKDIAFAGAAWLGILFSLLAVTGLSDRYSLGFSMFVWGTLWVLYLSFVNVGQTFYGFGWESLLLEAGFYAIFLGPASIAPPKFMIWMLRWLLFRVMFGAGLIKLRGDPCWRDLTCLDYYYDTQPMPNPLSWFFHVMPAWTHRAGVLFNHFAEVIVPFFYFIPGPISAIAGLITIVFQGMIMISGNLSWLNFLTMVIAIPALNDRWIGMLLPWMRTAPSEPHSFLYWTTASLGLLVAWLSINPIRNMLSPRQVMNTSYNPLHLVGSYGAFGGITRPRYEIIIEGTNASMPSPDVEWKAYEFKGKPGDPKRWPRQFAPYHLRLDWLMWFAAMSSYRQHPWFVNMIEKLLKSDTGILSLMRNNPFPDQPPRFIRANLYEYHFSTPEERKRTGQIWMRELVGPYFPPVSLQGES
jgi:hypothetical protein